MNPQKQKQTQLKTQDMVFSQTLQKLEQAREQAIKTQQWINIPIGEVSDNGKVLRLQLSISPSGVPMLQISTARITNKINLPSIEHLVLMVRLLNMFFNEIQEEKREAIKEFMGRYSRRKGARIFEL